jgi:hypothetical protein
MRLVESAGRPARNGRCKSVAGTRCCSDSTNGCHRHELPPLCKQARSPAGTLTAAGRRGKGASNASRCPLPQPSPTTTREPYVLPAANCWFPESRAAPAGRACTTTASSERPGLHRFVDLRSECRDGSLMAGPAHPRTAGLHERERRLRVGYCRPSRLGERPVTAACGLRPQDFEGRQAGRSSRRARALTHKWLIWWK